MLRLGTVVQLANHIVLIARDGREIPIGDSAAPIRLHDGALQGVVFIFRDITERRQAEMIRAKGQEELQLILDSTPALIFYKDRENHFVRVNRALCQDMGLPEEQIEGHSLLDFYPPVQAEAYWNDDKEVMQSGRPKLHIVGRAYIGAVLNHPYLRFFWKLSTFEVVLPGAVKGALCPNQAHKSKNS